MTAAWAVPSPPHSVTEMGNLAICNQKLIETITLPITIGNWQNSGIRVIGNAVDSITEPRKTIAITFYNVIKNIQFY